MDPLPTIPCATCLAPVPATLGGLCPQCSPQQASSGLADAGSVVADVGTEAAGVGLDVVSEVGAEGALDVVVDVAGAVGGAVVDVVGGIAGAVLDVF